ncbi:hypothetical protein BV25DRAFT_1832747 [Artomyces pyxidatus]|uniref:Uncharacterized protein n=1 Tax=Artomyces pyxidatus TaxID=48021 RepID=A0ACB8SIC0_9AGAM|nr:hypothetical protein BV25DRAFT_1832747 [Artomyces pyxidatus]
MDDFVVATVKPGLNATAQVVAQPPIARLPVEILSNIFSYLPFEDSDKDKWYATDGLPGWLAVTHVCRYWRSVAHGCHNLWAYIPLDNLEWTRIALERSKSSSIIILAPDHFKCESEDGSGYYIDAEAFLLACKSMNRAVDFRWWSVCLVHNDYFRLQRILDELLDSPVPFRLQSFDISVLADDRRIIEIPETLFGNQPLPNLSDVTFAGPLSIKTSLLSRTPSLTSLHLSEVEVDAWRTTAGVVETLRGLPLLQKLSLEGCLPYTDGVSPTEVILPHLTTLRIVDNILAASMIVPILFAPMCANLCLGFFLEADGMTELDTHAMLIHVLLGLFPPALLATNSYHTVAIPASQNDDDGLTRTIFSQTPYLAGPSKLPNEFSLYLTYSNDIEEYHDGDDNTVHHLFVDVIRHLPVRGVRELRVANYIFEHAFNWTALLNICTYVTHLTVSGTAVSGALFQGMLDPSDHDSYTLLALSSRVPHPMPLTDLSTITLERTDFTERRGPFSPLRDSMMMQTIWILTVARKNGCYPPFRLVLSNCIISPDQFKKLRAYMGDESMVCIVDG